MTLEDFALADRHPKHGSTEFGAQMVGHLLAEFDNQTTDRVAQVTCRADAFLPLNLHHVVRPPRNKK